MAPLASERRGKVVGIFAPLKQSLAQAAPQARCHPARQSASKTSAKDEKLENEAQRSSRIKNCEHAIGLLFRFIVEPKRFMAKSEDLPGLW